MRAALITVVAAIALAMPAAANAQTVPPADREALVALHVRRGGQAADLDDALRLADEAAAKGLPLRPITDKIREGIAKRAAPARITLVVRELAAHLETAAHLTRDWAPEAAGQAREAAVALLADALGSEIAPEDKRVGVSTDEVRALGRLLPPADTPAESAALLAHGAKGLSFIKDAGLPADAGLDLLGEAARRGYEPYDLLDLGRQIKLRERDYRTGRATLAALREAIARGERPDRLFRDRPARVERPARPSDVRPPARPERPVPVERPQRPGRP